MMLPSNHLDYLKPSTPDYWQVCNAEETSKHTADVSQIPYFILAIALLTLFILTLHGNVQPIVLIVALVTSAFKCF